MSISADIKRLKSEKKAIILAHTYTRGEVQDAADYVGDSYGLSKKAAEINDAEIIVFAGVRFMAETAAVLAPGKTVLLPVESSGCPMADMIDAAKLRALKEKYPEAAVACYVNSTAETKAESDVCVTSSNSVAIVRKLPQKQVIFVPDRHLGSFVAENVPEKEIILYDGWCPVHDRVTPQAVRKAKEMAPDAVVLMHPECPKETRILADHIFSTGQMTEFVAKKLHRKYLIVTEAGIIHSLKKSDPEAEFIELTNPVMYCVNMKKINPEDILRSLENNETEITVPEPAATGARKTLLKMLELGG